MMVLVDTSVWVDHLRHDNHDLRRMLDSGSVLCHPFVIGELACGNLRNRRMILDLLDALPCALVAQHLEVLRLVEERRLFGQGLGWIDMHLIASALLQNFPLWTLDKALRLAGTKLGVSFGAII
jgi:predicted nucleic acid-binding protein